MYLNLDTSIVFITKNRIFLHESNIKNRLVNHCVKRNFYTSKIRIMPSPAQGRHAVILDILIFS